MWEQIQNAIATLGFPIFVATYVLLGLKPEMRKLRDAIMTLTVVAAKSNGMSALDVKTIIQSVKESPSKGRRRAEDRIDDGFGNPKE